MTTKEDTNKQSSQKRLRRFQREHETIVGFRLTERDKQIIQAVAAYRFLSTTQIRRLFFAVTSKSSQCDQRLKLLYHHGYLERHQQMGIEMGDNKPILYSSTRKGLRLLQAQAMTDTTQDTDVARNSIRNLYLDHLLEVNDVRIAFAQACRLLGFAFERWIQEQAARAAVLADRNQIVQALYKQVAPDGVCIFSTGKSTLTFFIELDRGTETLGRVKKKLESYVVAYKSGTLTKAFGINDLRVLIITSSKSRLDNIVDTLRAIPENQYFACTYRTLVTAENTLTSPIWYMTSSNEPIILFKNRWIVDPAIVRPELEVKSAKVTEIFHDWWKAYDFPSIHIGQTQAENLAGTSVALCRWTPEQFAVVQFQQKNSTTFNIHTAKLLTAEESAQLLKRLYPV